MIELFILLQLIQGLKISFSLYAPSTSDECHAWFHLNTASPTERNTEQVNITKNLVHGRIQTPKITWPPDYKSTVFTTRSILQRYDWRN